MPQRIRHALARVAHGKLTLGQRVVASNLLMVLIPVVATAAVALACAAAIWHSLSLG